MKRRKFMITNKITFTERCSMFTKKRKGEKLLCHLTAAIKLERWSGAVNIFMPEYTRIHTGNCILLALLAYVVALIVAVIGRTVTLCDVASKEHCPLALQHLNVYTNPLYTRKQHHSQKASDVQISTFAFYDTIN
uniref:Uncharacterized protein n=1 Tax=Glossina brevipalpis TaxID=37001 RepID=A0A1A9W4Z6_9MUSC